MIKEDWFLSIKRCIVLLCKSEEMISEKKKQLFIENPRLFADDIALKWNTDIETILKINGQILQSYIRYINMLDKTGRPFNVISFHEEFEYILENYRICLTCFSGILDYIEVIRHFTNTLEQHDSISRFSNQNTDCINMVKTNNELIKQYRKEWRD